MRSVTYSQLRAFNAVAREGKISRAAKRLGVSQPAVTAQIRALERDFGVLLFERTGAGVRMTTLARTLFSQTETLTAVEEIAAEILSSQYALQAGEIAIAAGAPNPAMALITEFRRRYPGVRVTATFGNWAQVVSSVWDRRCDVAILTQAPREERLSVFPYRSQRIVALVPRGHKLASPRRPLSLRDLAAERVIFRTPQSLTQKSVDARLRELGIPIDPVLVLEAREAVFEAVAQGLGIGFMFDLAVSRTDRVVHVPIKELQEAFTEDVFCLNVHRRRAAVSAVFDLALELKGTTR
ncbi:MAG TPA: LysR family transcriptional regulator [Burkholderiales bacterium]|nr:LysR family transcriptional regulator [Burkholderiales bacterium]